MSFFYSNNNFYKNPPIKNFLQQDMAKKKCKQYTKIILRAIKKKFNAEKDTKKDIKFYKFLLEPLILILVEMIYLKYIIIKKKKIIKIETFNNYYPQIRDYKNFAELVEKSEDFNNLIVFDICKLLKKKIILKKKDYSEIKYKNFEFNNRLFLQILKFIFSKFSILISETFYKNKIIIDDQVFNFKDTFKLIFKSNFRICYFFDFKIRLNNFQFTNFNQENNFEINKYILYHDEFLNIFLKIFYKYLPDSYKYLLKNINKYEISSNKINKDILVTKRLSGGDEDFQLFLSINFNNIKIYSMQHGGGYGQIKNFSLEKYELQNSKKFLSWGWNNNFKKIDPMPQKKIIFKNSSHLKKKYSRYILFIGGNFIPYEYRINAVPLASQVFRYTNYVNSKIKIMNKLKKICKLIYRPHKCNNWYKDIKISKIALTVDKRSDFLDLARSADLIILTHISTSLMEILSLNVPTLIYLEKKLYRFEKNFKIQLDKFIKLGIMYRNVNKFIKNIPDNFKNKNFWYNKKTQQELNFFLDKYYKTSDNYLSYFCDYMQTEIIKK
jgi:putative transferase (TIGR04331 family)